MRVIFKSGLSSASKGVTNFRGDNIWNLKRLSRDSVYLCSFCKIINAHNEWPFQKKIQRKFYKINSV